MFSNYLGQGAWVLSNRTDNVLALIEDMNPFFLMLPQGLRPVAVLLGALAAIIASQALITGSYTLVSEAIRLDLMPYMLIIVESVPLSAPRRAGRTQKPVLVK